MADIKKRSMGSRAYAKVGTWSELLSSSRLWLISVSSSGFSSSCCVGVGVGVVGIVGVGVVGCGVGEVGLAGDCFSVVVASGDAMGGRTQRCQSERRRREERRSCRKEED